MGPVINKKIKKIIVILLITELIIVAAFGMAVYMLQSRLIADQKREELQAALNRFEEVLDKRNEDVEYFDAEYDYMLSLKAEQAAFYLNHLGNTKPGSSVLKDLAMAMELEEIHIMSEDGKVLVSSREPVIELTPEHMNAEGQALEESVGNSCFRTYAATLDNYDHVVVRTDADDFQVVRNLISNEIYLYTPTRLGFSGAVVLFEDDGNIKYIYDFENVYEEENIFEKGLSRAKLYSGGLKRINIGGNQYYISFKWIEKENAWLGLSVPQSMINRQVIATVILLVFCFFCIITLFNTYIIFLYSQSLKDINKEISHAAQHKERIDIYSLMKSHAKKLGRKVGVVVLIGTLIAFVLAVYLQNMSMISIYSSEAKGNLMDINERLNWAEGSRELVEDLIKKALISKAVTAAYIIGEEPEIRNMEDLEELNLALDTEYLVVFDQNGREVISNGRFVGIEISDDSNDPSYQLRSLMYGNSYVYTEPVEGEFSGEVHQDVGASIRTDGKADGFVVISSDRRDFEKLYEVTGWRNVYRSVNLANAHPIAINKDSKLIVFADSDIYEGKDARDYGLLDSELRDNFSGFVNFIGISYYATSFQRSDGNLIYLVTLSEVIGKGSLLFAVIICALMLAGLTICAVVNRLLVGKDLKKLLKGSIHVMKEEDEDGEGYPYVDVIMPDGSEKRAISVLGRFSLRDIEWDKCSPEQKLATVMRVFITIISLGVVAVMIFKNSIFEGDRSLVRYILNMEWERSINLFSITYSLLVICVILMINFILIKVMNRLAIIAGPKGETIIRMLKNFVKYISLIVGVCLCLSYMGVNVTTLLAGAGLVTLVIGLGAQPLISDCINGLFIIFEGDFQVGDIVTVDDFRGTVQEIGIRTTKIMSTGGDLKIVRNSTMKEILNMTRHNSRCICDILVEYKEDLSKTIEIFENEFSVIRENVPEIVEGPEFGGVCELSDNGVKLRFLAYCNEKDRFVCTYGINRELKLICERNNINVPFPQVVLHDGDK